MTSILLDEWDEVEKRCGEFVDMRAPTFRTYGLALAAWLHAEKAPDDSVSMLAQGEAELHQLGNTEQPLSDVRAAVASDGLSVQQFLALEAGAGPISQELGVRVRKCRWRHLVHRVSGPSTRT